MFPWESVGDLWVTKSEDVGLIVRAISFQDFQPMWAWSTNVTDGQTTCDLKTALCTIVHRAVKIDNSSTMLTAKDQKRNFEPMRMVRVVLPLDPELLV